MTQSLTSLDLNAVAVPQSHTRPLHHVRTLGGLLPSGVLFPHHYVWYIFVSSLDVMFTWVLLHFGGVEVNAIANHVLGEWDLIGLVAFKFSLVAMVICICEYVGRRNYTLGKNLGEWAVGITWIPVLLAMLQLMFDTPHTM